MSTGQAQPQQQSPTPGGALNAAYLAACILAAGVLPLLRSRWGKESPGIYGVGTLVLLLLMAGADPRMMLWLLIWFLFIIGRRVETYRLLRRGVSIHSKSWGYSWLFMRFPFVRKEKDAMILEILACILAGALMCAFSQVMAVLMWMICVSLIVKHGIEFDVWDRRIQRMNDSQIEGRWLSDRLRNGGDF